jgi:hypothetical protein
MYYLNLYNYVIYGNKKVENKVTKFANESFKSTLFMTKLMVVDFGIILKLNIHNKNARMAHILHIFGISHYLVVK